MSSDLRVIDLASTPNHAPPDAVCQIRPTTQADCVQLAVAYRDSYPPEIGAANLAEARREMEATFAGEFGTLRPDLSSVAEINGEIVGAILVTDKSIWDKHLPGPFIIDLFVSPTVRHQGVGTLLVQTAIAACREQGENTLSLRVGSGTSPAAFAIYDSLGFVDLDE